jgi:hypothetical protein
VRNVTLRVMPSEKELFAEFSQPMNVPGLPVGGFVKNKGRNYGLLPYGGLVHLLTWPSDPLALHPGVPRPRALESRHLVGKLWDARNDTLGGAQAPIISATMHNNVSPVRLKGAGEDGQDILLIVAHAHGASTSWGGHKTRFGSTYFHYFILTEADPPWRVLAQSAAWCLPSASNHRRCETIQFVTAAILSSEEATNISSSSRQLILGFGVNDCDARVQHLPLQEVIEFARQGTIDVGPLLKPTRWTQ